MKKFLLLLIVPLCFFGLIKKAKAVDYGYEIRFYETECYVPIGGNVYDYLPKAYVYDTVYDCIETDQNMKYSYNYQGIKFESINTNRPGHGIGYISAYHSDYYCPALLQKIDVYVYDDVAPTVNVFAPILKRYNEDINIMDYIDYSDNSTKTCMVELTGDFYPSVIGDYLLKVKVTDESDNFTEETFTIKVYDDIKPVIECDDIINVHVNSKFKKEDYIKVYDDYDGLLEYELPEIDTTVIGENYITINAVDSSNNKTKKTVLIKVLDDVKPTLILKSEELNVNSDYDFKKNIKTVSDNLDELTIDDVIIEQKRIGTQEFMITYKVYDSSFNYEIKTALAKINFKNSPVIEAINLDDLKDVFDPLYYVNCYDAEDGNLNDKVMVVDMNYDEKYCIYEVYDSDNNLTRVKIDFVDEDEYEKYEAKKKITFPTNTDLEQNPINDNENVIKNSIEYKAKNYNYLYYIILGTFVLGIIIFILVKHFRKKMV